MGKSLHTSAVSTTEAELEEMHETLEEQQKKQEVLKHITLCRQLYTSSLLSEATRRAYDDMFEGLIVENNLQYAEENVQLLQNTLNDAFNYRLEFETRLDRAAESGWISKDEAKERQEWFDDPELLEWFRKQWIQESFDGFLEKGKRIAEGRERVMAEAKVLGVSGKDDAKLAHLIHQESFLKLEAGQRESLVHEVDALLLSITKGKQDVLKSIRSQLQRVSSGERMCVHPSRVGQWLKEAMKAEDPMSYVESEISPRIDTWESLRTNFDQLQQDVRASKVPEGLRLPTAAVFLQWSPDAADAFLTDARQRLMLQSREEMREARAMDHAKKAVRSSMDAKDWEGAEQQLAALLQAHPDDTECADLQRYLELHRDDTKKDTKEVQSDLLLQEMQSIVQHLPASMKGLYLASLERGVLSFGQLMQHMDKAVWHAEQREPVTSLASAKTQTTLQVQRIMGGEEDEVEEEVAVTVLAVGDDEESQRKALDLVERNDAQSLKTGIRGLMGASVTLKQQRHLVQEVNGKLMTGLRQLDKQGKAFVMAA